MTKSMKSLPPEVKTGLTCIAAETFLFLAWRLVTRLVTTAIVCSLGVVGPISLLTGPVMSRRFTLHQRAKVNLATSAISSAN